MNEENKEFKLIDMKSFFKVEMFNIYCEHFFSFDGEYKDTTFSIRGNKAYSSADTFPIVYNFLNSTGIIYHNDKDYVQAIVDNLSSLVLAVGKAVIMSKISKQKESDNSDLFA